MSKPDRFGRDRDTGLGSAERFSSSRIISGKRGGRLGDADSDVRDSTLRRARNSQIDSTERSRKYKDDERGLRSDAASIRERRTRDSTGNHKREEGSWRDRVTEREWDRHDNSREYRGDKYGARQVEKTPEWLDEPADHSDSLNFANSEFANAVASSGLANLAIPKASSSKISPATSSISGNSSTGANTSTEHSIEEFQAWKARMKAADMDRKSKDQGELLIENDIILNAKPTSAYGDSADRFFSSFGTAVSLDDVKELSSSLDALGVKSPGEGGRASKFSSFFRSDNPNESVTAVSPEPPRAEHAPGHTSRSSEIVSDPAVQPAVPQILQSDDKEGFKRIMAILGNKPTRPAQSPVPLTSKEPSSVDNRTPLSPALPPSLSSGIFPNHKNQAPNPGSAPSAELPNKSRGNDQFLMGLMSGSARSRSQMQQSAPPHSVGEEIAGKPAQQPAPLSPSGSKSFAADNNHLAGAGNMPPGPLGLGVPPPGFDIDQADPRILQQMYQARQMRMQNGQGGAWYGRAGSFPPPQMPPMQQRGGRPIQGEMPPIMGLRFPSGIGKETDAQGGGNMMPQPPFLPFLGPPPNANAPPFPPGPIPPNFSFMGMPGPPPPMPPGLNPMQIDGRLPMPPPPLNGLMPNIGDFVTTPRLGDRASPGAASPEENSKVPLTSVKP